VSLRGKWGRASLDKGGHHLVGQGPGWNKTGRKEKMSSVHLLDLEYTVPLLPLDIRNQALRPLDYTGASQALQYSDLD
jgi:hypothetical protein